jgi:hypothetical protein
MRRGTFTKRFFLLTVLAITSVRADPSTNLPGANPSAAQGSPTSPVTEVLKLLRAHTVPDVIVAFVQSWPTPYLTSAEDLLRLRKAGAPPALLDAVARRGAELRWQKSMQNSDNRPNSVVPYPASPVTGAAAIGDLISPYPFSESLWWWANSYPRLYPGPGYYFGWWNYPRRWQ